MQIGEVAGRGGFAAGVRVRVRVGFDVGVIAWADGVGGTAVIPHYDRGFLGGEGVGFGVDAAAGAEEGGGEFVVEVAEVFRRWLVFG